MADLDSLIRHYTQSPGHMRGLIMEWYGYGRFPVGYLNSLNDRELSDLTVGALKEQRDLDAAPKLFREVVDLVPKDFGKTLNIGDLMIRYLNNPGEIDFETIRKETEAYIGADARTCPKCGAEKAFLTDLHGSHMCNECGFESEDSEPL